MRSVIGIDLFATALAAVYIGLGAFALLIDRIKGMASMRPFAAIALIAAAYTEVSASLYAGSFNPVAGVWLCRVGVTLIGFHTAAWLLVCRLSIPKTRSTRQSALLFVSTVCSASALIPGWVCLSGYALTWWGLSVLTLELLILSHALLNVRKSDWTGGRSAAVGTGLLFLWLGTTLEAVGLAGYFTVPFSLSLGYFALLITSAGVFGQAVLSSYGKLRALSEQLEHDVDLRNQELLQAQEALTRADRLAALGQLAAGVGHEINNPLTYVMTNLRELVERLPNAEDSSERIQLAGLASEALDGTERIRRVVGDLRLLTRSGENEQLELLDVHHVLGDALKLTEHVLRHRARVHEDYGDIPRVKAEAQRLAQVFVNLLVNAAQAIPDTSTDRGTITVRTRRSSTGRAVVEIIDNGQGISPQHLRRIFEPYFTTKIHGEGTGLGLFVSLGIVRSFGGELEVESELGMGTTMRVSLPASEFVEVFDPSPSQMLALVPRRAKILVIDDEPVVARAMRRMLPGHDVSIALDATHALQAFENGGLMDVIICDLMMPDISGVDLYVRACDRWPELKPRFLFMTGGAVTPKAQELLEQADVRCLHKPVRNEELMAMVDAIVASIDLAQQRGSSRPVW
jgi:signal transduction histidine kinase